MNYENNQIPPTVMDGLIVPGLSMKVYSALFFSNCVVFIKSGSISTDSAGSMRAVFGGYTGTGMIMGAVGSIIDANSRENRMEKTSSVAQLPPGVIAQMHKNNFLLLYENIKRIEFKGPNFADEVRVKIESNNQTYKFRIDKQSKSSAKYYRDVFERFLPQKVY